MEDKILQALESLKDDVNRKFDSLTNKVDSLTNEFGSLTNKVDSLTNEFGSLTNKVDSLTDKVDSLSEKVDNQGHQIKENTQILKALEHLAQVNKAEHDKMSFNIAEIGGELKAFGKSLSNIELITASNWGDIVKLKGVR